MNLCRCPLYSSAFNEGNTGHIHMKVIRPCCQRHAVRCAKQPDTQASQDQAKPEPSRNSRPYAKPRPNLPYLRSQDFLCVRLYSYRGWLHNWVGHLEWSSKVVICKISSIIYIIIYIYKNIRKIILSSQWPSKVVIYKHIPSKNPCCNGKLALTRLLNRKRNLSKMSKDGRLQSLECPP